MPAAKEDLVRRGCRQRGRIWSGEGAGSEISGQVPGHRQEFLKLSMDMTVTDASGLHN